MKLRTRHLKIKIKSLAAEAAIIRHEEHRLGLADARLARRGEKRRHDADRCDLMAHRKEVVRPTARASMLAYACLRSVPYARVEQVCGVDNHPDWDEVGKEAARFGATSAAIESWSVDAKAHVDA